MTIAELKLLLKDAPNAGLHLQLPDGDFVPSHFHVTEVGRVHKDFIDCGGTTRSSTTCVLQVWIADDHDHRLTTTKLNGILKMATPLLGSEELPVEIEYEGAVVSQYPVTTGEITPSGVLLQLGTKHTDCLAKDRCGVSLTVSATGCTPAGGCC